jgi:hypothetical protein
MYKEKTNGHQRFELILDKRENKSESSGENLDKGLKIMANQVNEEFGYFLSPDGSVDYKSQDYRLDNKKKDQTYIDLKEAEFASKEGLNVNEWLKKRENNNGIITEKAVTLLFHKIFGDKFIVARSSKFDDYRHGFDMMIIDKQTGALVCGFDEMGDSLKKVMEVKGEKIKNSLRYNGTEAKYCANIKQGKLIKISRRNVPSFFLALSESDLEKVLPTVLDTEVSDAELKVVGGFLDGLDDQITNIYQAYFRKNFPDERDSINFFAKRQELLAEMDKIAEEYGEGWTDTVRGENWKDRMGRNNLRFNLKNFQRSLLVMKAGYEDLKNKK